MAVTLDTSSRLDRTKKPEVERLEGRQLLSVAPAPLVATQSGGTTNLSASPSTTQTTAQPSIRFTSPSNLGTNVSVSAPIEADLNLPNGAISASTIISANVYLQRSSDQSLVPAVVNTSGGGDSIILTPTSNLAPNTQYTFIVTSAVADITGAPMVPFTMTFTTGAAATQSLPSVQFSKTNLASATGAAFTCVKIGPDGDLWASTEDGRIFRWAIGAGDTLGAPTVITAIQTANGGAKRLITGFAFDPSSTAANPILWISNSFYALSGSFTGVDFTGKITKLSFDVSTQTSTVTDAVVSLPRSVADHSTEQPTFGPGPIAGHEYLYFAQASNTAYGAPDSTWGNRPEHLLSAAILRVDVTALNLAAGPLNVLTPDAGGTYNPFAAGAPLVIYASGVRNAFSILFAQNGDLLAVNNGSSAGGNTPAYNASDPNQINGARIDTGKPYSGPNVPGETNVQLTENDYLYNIKQGGYYGHPNPTRGEYVLNDGNPSTGAISDELVPAYPAGTNPDSNYRGAAWNFGPHASADGIIEYQDKTFDGALQGALLVTEYSAGNDIVALQRDSAGNVINEVKGITGLTSLGNPLSLVEDTNTGNIFVSELGGQRIVLLRAVPAAGHATASSNVVVFNSIATGHTGAGPSRSQSVTITNTGTTTLSFAASNAFSIVADPAEPTNDAATFAITNLASQPATLAPGASTTVSFTYTATIVGLQYARLQVNSSDPNGPLYVQLHGIGTAGQFGYLEPSLVQVLRANDIPTIVGAGPNDVNINTTQYPINPDPSSQEVPMQRLIKAGPGAVTITPLAAFNSTASPTVRLGYYTPGDTSSSRELFTLGAADAQTVSPTALGATSFDPGSSTFSLYASFPGTYIGKGLLDTHYSEDRLNTLDAAHPRKFRFFPLKTASGAVVPNSYIVAAEDYNSTTYNSFVNFVGIISNVKAASDAVNAPVLGLKNLSGLPSSTRLAFNRIQIPNTTVADVVHDTNVIQITNTGDQPLVIGSLVLSDSANWTIVNPPAAGASIAPGASLSLTIKFIATSAPAHTYNELNDTVTTNGQSLTAAGGVWNGTLTINSNDPVAPAKVITLAGYWQYQTEHENEPGLQTIVNLVYGYGTVISNIQQPNYINASGGSVVTYFGEELQNPGGLYNVADPTQSVTVTQLAAYHNEYDSTTTPPTATATIMGWYPSSTNKTTWLFQDQIDESQTLFQTIKGSSTSPAAGSFTSTGSFGFNIDGEKSTDALNATDINTYHRSGHSLRFYPVRDASGNLVPNQYLMVMDYQNGVYDNSDYQDNVYLVSNIRPTIQAPAPADVQSTGGVGGVTLQWAPVSDSNLTGYNVYRSTSETGTYTRLTASPITSTAYIDATAPAGQASYYKVTAVDAAGESLGVNTSAPAIPAAPTGLLATPINAASAKLTWYGVVGNSLYHIEREVVGGSGFVEVGTSATTSFTDTGLSATTNYVYQIRAQNTSGYSPYSIVATVTTPSGVAPAAPTGLSASLNASNQVVLNWTAPAGSTVTAYHVERELSGTSAFTEIAANVIATTFTDVTAVAGTTYLYRVRAENNGSLGAYNATPVTITTTAVTLPAAPASVSATGVSPSQVNVSWTAVSGATSYVIQRKAATDATWTVLSSAWTAGTTFADQNVEPSTSYTYQVAAANASGTGAFTSAALTTAFGAYQSADINATPAGATVDNVDGSSYDVSAYGVDIGSTATDSFRFEYQQVTGNFDAVVHVQSLLNTFSTAKAGLMVRATLDAGSAMVFDGATAASSFRWLYRAALNAVPSFNSIGPSVAFPNVWVRLARSGNVFTGYYSTDGLSWTQAGTVTLALPNTVYLGMAVTSHNTSAATTAQFRSLSVLTPPAAPVASAAAASPTAVAVSWASVPSASSYTVLRYNPATSAYASIATGVTTTSYNDSGLTASTSYQYEVIAVNTVGSSPLSNVATALTTPLTPTGLSGNAPSPTEIDLSWSPSIGATSYTLIRSSDGGATWSVPLNVGNVTSYQDKSVAPGTAYKYEVIATNAGGSSTPSAAYTISAQPAPAPAAPTGLTGTSPAPHEIDLSWSASTNAASYAVERSTDGGTTWSTPVNVGSALTYKDTGVIGNTQYAYAVIATNSAGSSPASTPFTVLSASTFSSADIASTATGSTTTVADDSAYTVTAGGTGIYNTSDSFRFVYTQVTGNFDIAVQVSSLSGTGVAGSYPQAGLMVRQSLAASSQEIAITSSPVGGYRFKVRATAGAATTQTETPTTVSAAYPGSWVRLTRVGNVFTSFYSTDGIHWTTLGAVTETTFTSTTPVYIGMAVASNTASATTTATFQNFTGA